MKYFIKHGERYWLAPKFGTTDKIEEAHEYTMEEVKREFNLTVGSYPDQSGRLTIVFADVHDALLNLYMDRDLWDCVKRESPRESDIDYLIREAEEMFSQLRALGVNDLPDAVLLVNKFLNEVESW